MTPARITYHALNVAVSLVLCTGMVAIRYRQHVDWLAVGIFTAAAFNAISSLNALHRDKP